MFFKLNQLECSRVFKSGGSFGACFENVKEDKSHVFIVVVI